MDQKVRVGPVAEAANWRSGNPVPLPQKGLESSIALRTDPSFATDNDWLRVNCLTNLISHSLCELGY